MKNDLTRFVRAALHNNVYFYDFQLSPFHPGLHIDGPHNALFESFSIDFYQIIKTNFLFFGTGMVSVIRLMQSEMYPCSCVPPNSIRAVLMCFISSNIRSIKTFYALYSSFFILLSGT